MPTQSAGILPFRQTNAGIEVFLVHPGGPYWAKKDAGAWTIPKGEFLPGEDPLAAARRELAEETGFTIDGPFAALGSVRLSSGKIIHAFAAPADFDAAQIVSNTFRLPWPPRSGRFAEFPEVDRAGWFPLAQARIKLMAAQLPLLDRLADAAERGRI